MGNQAIERFQTADGAEMLTMKAAIADGSAVQSLQIPGSLHLRGHLLGGRVVLSAASLLTSLLEHRDHEHQQREEEVFTPVRTQKLTDLVFLKRVELRAVEGEPAGLLLHLVDEEDEGLIQVFDAANSIVFVASDSRFSGGYGEQLADAKRALFDEFRPNPPVEVVQNDVFYAFMREAGYEHADHFAAVHWVELHERTDEEMITGTVILRPSAHLDAQLDGLLQAIVFAALRFEAKEGDEKKREDRQFPIETPDGVRRLSRSLLDKADPNSVEMSVLSATNSRTRLKNLLVPFSVDSLEWRPAEDHELAGRWATSGRFRWDSRNERGDFVIVDGRTDRVLMAASGVVFRSTPVVQLDEASIRGDPSSPNEEEPSEEKKEEPPDDPADGEPKDGDGAKSRDDENRAVGKDHPIDRNEAKEAQQLDVHAPVFHNVQPPLSPPTTGRSPSIGIRAMSCRLPGGVCSPDDFWALLTSGKTTDQRLPAARLPARNLLIRGHRYAHPLEGANFIDGGGREAGGVDAIGGFDARLFGWSANEARAADPQQRLVLKCAYECAERAGVLTADRTALRRMGVFVGQMGAAEYADTNDLTADADRSEPKDDALLMLGAQPSVMSGRLSHFFDSRGPSVVVDTACSSSLVAMDAACAALSSGRIDLALVAGVNVILSARAMGQRANGRLLAADGRCKSFDARADGYGRADGCVVMMLERAVDGWQYEATIDATTVNHDGRSVALTAPNGEAQRQLIVECLERAARKEGGRLVAWECHGTGTSLGDPIELNALQQAVGDAIDRRLLAEEEETNKTAAIRVASCVWLSTAKATVGHTEAAAGLVGVMKAVLQLQHAAIPPLPDFRSLNPQIRLASRFELPTDEFAELSDESNDRAVSLLCGVSAFGVGGTNACAVISRPLRPATREIVGVPDWPTIVPISAKSDRSLRLLVDKTRDLLLKTEAKRSLLAAAAALHRRHFERRAAILVDESGSVEVITQADGTQPTVRIEVIEKKEAERMDGWSTIPAFRRLRSQLISSFEQPEKSLDKSNVLDVTAAIRWLLFVGFDPAAFDSTSPLVSAALRIHTAKSSPKVIDEVLSDLADALPSSANFDLRFFVDTSPALRFELQTTADVQRAVGCLFVHSRREIDWNFVFDPTVFDREEVLKAVKLLPTYQFDEQRYWRSERTSRATAFDHPFVGNPIEWREDGERVAFCRFEGHASRRRLPEFFERTGGKWTIGTAVEVVNAIFGFCRPQHALRIAEWTFDADCSLPDDSWIGAEFRGGHGEECVIEVGLLAAQSGDFRIERTICKVRGLCRLDDESAEKSAVVVPFNTPSIPALIPPQTPRSFVTDGERRAFEFAQNVAVVDQLIDVANHENSPPERIQLREVGGRRLTHVFSYTLAGRELRCLDKSGRLLIAFDSSTHESAMNGEQKKRVEIQPTIEEKEETPVYPKTPLLPSHLSLFSIDEHEEEETRKTVARLLQSSISDGVRITAAHFDSGFFDLGADSLAMVGFANELSRAAGMPRVTTADLLAHPTVNKLTAFVQKRKVEEAKKKSFVSFDEPTEIAATDGRVNGRQEDKPIDPPARQPKAKEAAPPPPRMPAPHFHASKFSTVSLPVVDENAAVGSPREDAEANAPPALLYAVERPPLLTSTPHLTAVVRSLKVRILLKTSALAQNTPDGDVERETIVYLKNGRQRAIVTFAALARRLGGAAAVEFSFAAPPLPFGNDEQKTQEEEEDAQGENRVEFRTAAISRLFVRLGRTLLDVRRPAADAAHPMEIRVRQAAGSEPNAGEWLSAMAAAFLKSFCAENPTQFAFRFTERLRPLEDVRLDVEAEEPSGVELPECWIVTGGTSGIGWLMARHLLAAYSVERVYVIGRRWPVAPIAAEVAAVNEQAGAKRIEIKLADVCDRERVRELSDEIAAELAVHEWRLGLIHSAGCVDDRLLSAQNVERFGRVLDAKCRGLLTVRWALEAAGIRPSMSVYNSSVSSVLGNTGQSNYAAANALLDHYADRTAAKQADGLAGERAIAINWANWLEAGFAANDVVRALLRRKGFFGLRTPEALAAFDWALRNAADRSQVFVARADWRQMFEFRPDLRPVVRIPFDHEGDEPSGFLSNDPVSPQEHQSMIVHLTASDSQLPTDVYAKHTNEMESVKELTTSDGSFGSSGTSFSASSAEYFEAKDDQSLITPPTHSPTSSKDIRGMLEREVRDLLRLKPSDPLDSAAGFMELGVDSFGMFSLTNTINRRVGRSVLSVIHLFEHATVDRLTAFLEQEMAKRDGAAADGAKEPEERKEAIQVETVHTSEETPAAEPVKPKIEPQVKLPAEEPQRKPTIEMAESPDFVPENRVEFALDPLEFGTKETARKAGGIQDHHPLEMPAGHEPSNEAAGPSGQSSGQPNEKKNDGERNSQDPPTASSSNQKGAEKKEEMKRPNLVFLFAGHGSLYPRACVHLSQEVPYVATQIRLCSDAFAPHLPGRLSIEEHLLVEADASRLLGAHFPPPPSASSKSVRKPKEPQRLPLAVEHAAIFTVGYSLAQFWQHVGLRPTHLIGHSLGELVAACLSGFVTLEAAAELVCLRAGALEKHRGKAAMLALDSEFGREHAAQFGLQIAAVNGPRQVVLSGAPKNVAKARAVAEQKREAATVISDEFGFHSDKHVKSEHLKALHRFDWTRIQQKRPEEDGKQKKPKKGVGQTDEEFPPTPPSSPVLISNLDGRPLERFDRHYVKKHAQSTVEFWSCVEAVLAEGEATFVEVTAGRVLTGLVQKILNARHLRYLVVPTVHSAEPNELDTLKWTAQKLQLKGHPVDDRAFSRAIGEDFVERAASAFSSSFRLAKSNSLNARKHHLVAWPPRPSADSSIRRGVSVRTPATTKLIAKEEAEGLSRSNSVGTQLILHQRPVEVGELDVEVAAEHRLFDVPIAPAAFQLKTLAAHLRMAEITMRDVRFAQKLHADELGALETVFRDGRLQLKRSTADIGAKLPPARTKLSAKAVGGGLAATLFSSCIVDVPEAPTRRVSAHPPADLAAADRLRLPPAGRSMAVGSVPQELNVYVERAPPPAPPNSATPQQRDAPEFPDSDPGIWLSPAKFYDGMAAHGFAYGSRLRLLTDIRLIGASRIRTRSRKPAAPWLLFDAALQTLSTGLYDARRPACFVPVGMDEVWSRFPTAEEFVRDAEGQFTYHAELTRRAGDLVEGSVWIFARGVLIGYLRNVRAIRATQATMAAETRARRKKGSRRDESPSFSDGEAKGKNGQKKPPATTGTKGAVRGGGGATNKWTAANRAASFAHEEANEAAAGGRRFSAPSAVHRIATAVHAFKRTRQDFCGVPTPKVKMKAAAEEQDLQEANGVVEEPSNHHVPPRSITDILREKQEDVLDGCSPSSDHLPKAPLIVVRSLHAQFATDDPELPAIFAPFAQPAATHANLLRLSESPAHFDCERFGLTPREAQWVDPLQRVLLKATDECLAKAGLRKAPPDCGVFVGVSSSDFAQRAFAEAPPDGYLMAGTNGSALAGRIAHHFEADGPTTTLDAACASFHAAVCVAADAIRAGRCAFALVGAANVALNAKTTRIMRKAGVLSSTDRCAAFDATADGFVRSEGYAMVLLEGVHEKAINRAKKGESGDLLVLSGWSFRHAGGRSAGFCAPSAEAECRVMCEAAGGRPVDVIEAHGTGTPLGDPIEAEAIARFLRSISEKRAVHLHASKSRFGHSEAAAGAASFASALALMNADCVPPVRHFRSLNSRCSFPPEVVIPSASSEHKRVDRVLINAFGFTGTVAALCLERRPTGSGANRRLAINATPIDLAPERPQFLWPFRTVYADDKEDEFEEALHEKEESLLSSCPFELEPSRSTLDRLLDDAQLVVSCGQQALAFAVRIEQLDAKRIRLLTSRIDRLLLIWTVGSNGDEDDRLAADCAHVCRLMSAIARRELRIDVFLVAPKRRVPAAFALLESARLERGFAHLRLHVLDDQQGGKGLLRGEWKIQPMPPSIPLHPLQFGSVLITGGAKGIGRVLLDRLRPTAAVVVGRSAQSTAGWPPGWRYERADVSDAERMAAVFRHAHPPLQLVIHAAGVVENALLAHQSAAHFRRLFEAKVGGTRNLLRLCSEFDVPHFAALSSVAALFGSFGQANYAVANAEMSALMDESPVDCSHFFLGPVEDVGMLSGDEKRDIRRQIEENTRWSMMSSAEVVEQIARLIGTKGRFLIARTNEQKTTVEEPPVLKTREEADRTTNGGLLTPLTLQQSPAGPTKKDVEDGLRSLIAEVTGLRSIPPTRGLMSLGVDSLMVEKLRQAAQQSFRVEISPAEMYENVTLDSLVRMIAEKTSEQPIEAGMALPEAIQADVLPAKEDKEVRRPRENPSISSPTTTDEDDESTSPLQPLVSPAFRPSDGQSEVSIVGFAGEFPQSDGLDEFFGHLLAGRGLFAEAENETKAPNFVPASSILRNNGDRFDFELFGLSREEAAAIDPQVRVLVELAARCFEAAGCSAQRRANERIAVFAAAEPPDGDEDEAELPAGSLIAMYRRNRKDFAALWIAHLFGLRGPALNVYAACSSALVGVAQAVHLLRSDPSVDGCLVAAVHSVRQGGHVAEGGSPMATEGRCRPFSREASGILRGSGAGVLLLRRTTDAERNGDRILARIRAIAVNNDANRRKSNFLAPSAEGQQEAMKAALRSAGCSRLDFVECHATGTSVGDQIEVRALGRALKSAGIADRPFLGSLKANIGHSFAAAGMMSIAKCLKVLESGRIPPQINVQPNDQLDEIEAIGRLNREVVRVEQRSTVVMINAFGIGGTNASMILERTAEDGRRREAEEVVEKPLVHGLFVLPLSAHTAALCVQRCHELAVWLKKDEDTVDLPALSNTLLNYRDHHTHRVAFLVADVSEAIRRLEAVELADVREAKEGRQFAFYFGHQGLQYERMLAEDRQLCPSIPLIDDKEEDVVQLLRLFHSTLSFFRTIEAPQPAVVFGHSFGEFGALMAADLVDFERLLEFVRARARLCATTAPARMFAVRIAEEEAGGLPDGLELSAVLGPDLCAFSCALGDADDVRRELEARRLDFVELPTERGFHSARFMRPILREFCSLADRFVQSIAGSEQTIPVISNVDGRVVRKPTELSAAYLAAHLGRPVRLDLSLRTLRKHFEEVDVIVEVGPSSVLHSVLDRKHFRLIPTGQSAAQFAERPEAWLLRAAADLWTVGVDVNLRRLFGETKRRLHDLPPYPFDRQELRIKQKKEEAVEASETRVGDAPRTQANENDEDKKTAEKLRTFEQIWRLRSKLQGDPTLVSQLFLITPAGIESKNEMLQAFARCGVEVIETTVQQLPARLRSTGDSSEKTTSILYFHQSTSSSSRVNQAAFFELLELKAVLRQYALSSIHVFVCSLSDDPAATLSCGAMDEIERNVKLIRTSHVLFDRLDSLPAALSSLPSEEGELRRFQVQNGLLFQLDYAETTEDPAEKPKDKTGTFLLVGAGGSLGQALIDRIQPNGERRRQVVVITRRPLGTTGSDSKLSIHEFRADVLDSERLEGAMAAVRRQFGPRIQTAVFLVGRPPHSADDAAILSAKVDGLTNLLRAAAFVGLQFDRLLLCSSLSATSGLPDIAAYASANCFLDHQPALAARSIAKRILSLQLPPLLGSRMMSGEATGGLLGQNSVRLEAAAEWILAMRTARRSGVFAFSRQNPMAIRRFIRGSFAGLKEEKTPLPARKDFIDEPKTPADIRERLQEIWRSVLPFSSPFTNPTDDFFRSGGNSLSALQMVWRIQEEFGVQMTVEELHSHSAFSPLVDWIEAKRSGRESFECPERILRTTARSGPLSLSQEQMWILYRTQPLSYNIVYLLEFRGHFDPAAAQRALRRLIERQTALRSRFFVDKTSGDVRQEVMDVPTAFERSFLVEQQTNDENEEKWTAEMIERERNFRFDVSHSAFRFVLLQPTEGEGVSRVVINQQHIVTDGWSITIFAREFSAFYRAEINGGEAKGGLSPLPIEFLDFAHFNRRSFDERKCAQFAARLSALPAGGTSLWPQNSDSTEGRPEDPLESTVRISLPVDLCRRVDEVGRQFGVTRFLLFLTAFLRSVDRWRLRSKEEDGGGEEERLVIGCPTAGRERAETADLIGYFLNNLVIAVDPKETNNPELSAALRSVQREVNRAKEFADVPFHRAVARMRAEGGSQAVFQLFFNFRHRLDHPTVDLGPQLECSVRQLTNNNVFQLSCTIDELDDENVRISLDFDPRSLSRPQVESFGEDFCRELARLDRPEDFRVGDFLYPTEDPLDDFIGFEQVIHLFADRCRAQPTRPAVLLADGRELTYGELWKRVCSKAAFLHRRSEDSTAEIPLFVLLLDRNAAVEWILAALVLGAAFCPLDPKETAERRAEVLEDLPNAIVVFDSTADEQQSVARCWIDVNDHEPSLSAAPDLDVPWIPSQQLAYVLFTSGSTGRPKGVEVEHSQLARFVRRATRDFRIDSNSRVAHTVNTTFDVSLFNIFAPLCAGGRLEMRPEIVDFVDHSSDGGQPFTHLFLTSAFFNSLPLERVRQVAQSTGWLIVGGETPAAAHLRAAVEAGRCVSQIYGPTEATVWCSVKHYAPNEDGRPNDWMDGRNIGTPTQSFFLTTPSVVSSLPLPRNSRAVGELWICGDQVARGYSHCKEESCIANSSPSLSFVQNPFGVDGRAYRTGDLVRLLSAEPLQLEFVGRLDERCKLRGVRCNRADVRHQIAGILEANRVDGRVEVAIQPNDQQTTSELLVFVEGKADGRELKSLLSARLPPHLTPHRVVAFPCGFPLNSSGKLDRRAMIQRAKEDLNTPQSIHESPGFRSKTTRKLAEIWARLIADLPPTSIDERADFFRSGGHSLLLLRLQAEIEREFGVALSFQRLHQHARLGEQAALIDEERGRTESAGVIQTIRQSSTATTSVYFVHAIGGTIFAFFPLANWWPAGCNVFAIAYEPEFPADTLRELAAFYRKHIEKHAAAFGCPFFLCGHSLGGILCWEIACGMEADGRQPPIVCALDSWVVDNHKLAEEQVLVYLKFRFSALQNSEEIVEGAMRLCGMLKRHRMRENPHVPLRLFKADRLGQTALRHVIRKDLTDEMIAAKTDNGWRLFVDDLLVHPCTGDHESMLETRNLREQAPAFEAIIQEVLDSAANHTH